MNRRVLVLGGNGDIGKAIVEKFKNEGDVVTSTSRHEMDLTDMNSIDVYFKTHPSEYEVIVQSAGLNNPKSIEEVTPEDMIKALAVNTLGFFRVVQHLLPYFKSQKNGHILAISSLYGSFSRAKRLPYSTAKHALGGVIKTLALELGPYNIKVNSLSPGFVDTKMTRKNNDVDTIRSFERKIALKRLAEPKDIAEVAVFLCSEKNQYLHGQDIIVDGGFSVGGFQES